MIAIDEGLIQV